MKITSSAFKDNQSIPPRHTADGSDIIPQLTFEEVPREAKSLALVVDDPDVPRSLRPDGNWDHWVVWNIPIDVTAIEEARPPRGVVGRNSWGKNAYGGPAPPDREHRYFFKLYALDTMLDLPQKSGKGELEEAMKGHILAEAKLMGRYERQKVAR